MPIEIKVVRTRSGIRNAHTRMPFRFGVITMRAAPVLTIAVQVEDRRGSRATGYAADVLAYRWFDHCPEKSLADNCADLLRAVEVAGALYFEAGEQGHASPFALWPATYPEIEADLDVPVGRRDDVHDIGRAQHLAIIGDDPLRRDGPRHGAGTRLGIWIGDP
jgi:hypothetical protein